MKMTFYKSTAFFGAFLIGSMLSFDNSLTVWPLIPDVVLKSEVRVVCSLGPKRNDGRDACVCLEVEE